MAVFSIWSATKLSIFLSNVCYIWPYFYTSHHRQAYIFREKSYYLQYKCRAAKHILENILQKNKNKTQKLLAFTDPCMLAGMCSWSYISFMIWNIFLESFMKATSVGVFLFWVIGSAFDPAYLKPYIPLDVVFWTSSLIGRDFCQSMSNALCNHASPRLLQRSGPFVHL